jgi:hypothetical protein
MGKRQTNRQARFRPGTSGGCEALLYEFRDFAQFTAEAGNGEVDHCSLGSRSVRIAATDFEDAFAHLRKSRPDFRVESVRYAGLVEVSSGSPLD